MAFQPQITLYVDGYFINPFDATCLIALAEKQVPFSVARALLRDGQGLPMALHDKTALARVPAFQHGDFYLTESLAIVEYIEETFPTPAYAPLLPVESRARARARQIMAFLRCDLRVLRRERPWFYTVYPPRVLAPLSPIAERDARELLTFVHWLTAAGDLAEWNIAHADLALALHRLARTDYPLPAEATRLIEASFARPSVSSYLDRARPPHPPPLGPARRGVPEG